MNEEEKEVIVMKEREVILCIGIPASGKSTWSKEFIGKNAGWVRVNRDEYRIMFKNQYVCEPKIENFITKCVNHDILSALHANLNVIVDQTNCKKEYIEQLCDLVKHFAVVNFRVFDISVEKAIERDKGRTAVVGEAVIKRMYKNYKDLMDGFDFTARKPVPIIIKEAKNTKRLPEAVIVDLDGTLAFNNGKRGWYDDNCLSDDLSETVKEQVLFQKSKGRNVIIVSGRDTNSQESTEMWLSHHEIPYDKLYLRKFGDYRKDHIIKEEIYNNFIKGMYFVRLVYEDRESVVEMWRGLGLKCFQVDFGKY